MSYECVAVCFRISTYNAVIKMMMNVLWWSTWWQRNLLILPTFQLDASVLLKVRVRTGTSRKNAANISFSAAKLTTREHSSSSHGYRSNWAGCMIILKHVQWINTSHTGQSWHTRWPGISWYHAERVQVTQRLRPSHTLGSSAGHMTESLAFRRQTLGSFPWTVRSNLWKVKTHVHVRVGTLSTCTCIHVRVHCKCTSEQNVIQSWKDLQICWLGWMCSVRCTVYMNKLTQTCCSGPLFSSSILKIHCTCTHTITREECVKPWWHCTVDYIVWP